MLKRKMLYSVACMSLLAASLLAGCSSSGGGGSNPENNPAATEAISTPSADGNIQATIGGVTINSPPVVTFALSDEQGQPLDPVTFIKAGGTLRFHIARISADGSAYQNYIGTTGPSSESATATSTFTTVKPGVYTYTFVKDITDSTQTYKNIVYDRSLTHTVAMQIARNVTRNGKSFQQAANPYITFRPDGVAVTTTREIVSTSACNECHGVLGIHGGGRRDVMLCIMCHNPDLVNATTGISYDMKTLIHKIHYGAKLPSSKLGAKYGQGSSNDYSKVGYPMLSSDSTTNSTPIDCVKCHKLGTDTFGKAIGKDVDRWKTQPTRANCTTCHDTTTFDGSATLAFNSWSGASTLKKVTKTLTAVKHPTNQTSDAGCAGCHASTGTDFDAISVPGMHTVFEKSSKVKAAAGSSSAIVAKVVRVDNVGPAKAPKVTFQITDGTGKAYAFKNNSSSISIRVAIKRVNEADWENIPEPTANVRVFGSYTTIFSGANGTAASATVASGSTSALAKNQLITVDATKGIYAVDYATYLGYATGGKPRVLPGINSAYYTGGNAIVGFAVQATRSDLTVKRRGATAAKALGATVTPVYYDLASGLQTTDSSAVRRNVVDTAKCNKCHGGLVGFHGAGRANVEYCGFCHTPNNAVGAGAVAGAPAVAGDVKVFVHKIHRGPALADETYSFEGAVADGYPNDLRRCDACHISGDPLVTSTYATRTDTTAAVTDFVTNRVPAWVATCTSCHDATTGTVAGSTAGAVGHATANAFVDCTFCHNDAVRSTGHQPSR